jgi:hypothetical protein
MAQKWAYELLKGMNRVNEWSIDDDNNNNIINFFLSLSLLFEKLWY